MKSARVLQIITIMLLALSLVGTATAGLSDRILGESDAPVTLEMFTDFEGPFCSRWHIETFPLIDKHFIEEGDVKLIVRHFPLSFHQRSQPASRAAECAGEQGEFFDYIDILYTHQDKLTDDDLEDYASDVGLDLDEFVDCLDDKSIQKLINDDIQIGGKQGVRGTPAFFVNGEIISGAQPYTVFEEEILEALGEEPPEEPVPLDMLREPQLGRGKIIIEGYMGFNDPFSKRSWDTINKVVENYEDDVSFLFRNLPFSFNDRERVTAQAAECVVAKDEEVFFDFVTLLLEDPNTDLDETDVIRYARSLGLGISTCLEDEKYLPEVLDDIQDSEKLDVTGTPTFFINKKKVSGAQPYEVFAEIIDEIIGEKPRCGDGICQDDEDSETCPEDCDTIPPIEVCVPGLGCEHNDGCIPTGHRLQDDSGRNVYCGIGGDLNKQKVDASVCQNDYECRSNQCSNSKCINLEKEVKESNSLLQKILDFLGNLFR